MSNSHKVLIIGDMGVGKTCLLRRFVFHDFAATPQGLGGHLTAGLDCKSQSVRTAEGELVWLQLWDTAGQERFKTVTTSYYRGAQAVLVCFDVSSRSSVVSAASWLADARNNTGEDALLWLCAMKIDLEAAEGVAEDARNLVEKMGGLPLLRTSAKQDRGVREAFSAVAEALVQLDKARRTSVTAAAQTKALKLEAHEEATGASSCCFHTMPSRRVPSLSPHPAAVSTSTPRVETSSKSSTTPAIGIGHAAEWGEDCAPGLAALLEERRRNSGTLGMQHSASPPAFSHAAYDEFGGAALGPRTNRHWSESASMGSSRSVTVEAGGGDAMRVRVIPPEELVLTRHGPTGEPVVLGSGSFGIVMAATYRGAKVATKRIHAVVRGSVATQQPLVADNELLAEAATMQRCNGHPHVLHFYGVVLQPPAERGFVTERLRCSLEQHLRRDRGGNAEPFGLLVRWCSEGASGVLHLHCEDVVHADIAARNLLLTHSSPPNVRVCDFGLARFSSTECGDGDVIGGSRTGTGGCRRLAWALRWTAPECLRGESEPTLKSDIFSLGITFWECLARTLPYSGLDARAAALEVLSGLRPNSDKAVSLLGPEVREDPVLCALLPGAGGVSKNGSLLLQLMEMMWHPDPGERPDLTLIHSTLAKIYDLETTAPRVDNKNAP